jgi:hypothetical protein
MPHIPPAGNSKPLSEMTRRELVGSLVAFTVIVAFVDTITVVQGVQRGFSIFSAVAFVLTSIILALAYRRFLGELSRRRRAQHRSSHDHAA